MTTPRSPRGGKTTAELLFDGHAILAEGPVYSAADHALLWIDIESHLIHRLELTSRDKAEMNVGQAVGAVVLRAGGGLAIALRDGFAVTDRWGGAPTLIASPEKDKPENRMNDGKCDRAGRFWAGTMAFQATPGAGALYRLDPDHSARTMLTGVTISNGLAWSLDDKEMYYIDTPLARVDVFDFDAPSGAIHNRRTLFEVPKENGAPDGMTIDAEGCLWVAHWGGGAVRRYTPKGVVDRTIEVPASKVTSCTFGGGDLSDLYITTASIGLSAEQKSEQPHAGGIFVARTGVKGTSGYLFKG
jgi:sugar lactone lactonase YvrE